jgi:hypothetical protein
VSDDRITVGVTHEVLIDGERSWIKYEINTGVEPTETLERARGRASRMLNDGVMRLIAETVETVRGRTDEV